MVFAGVLIGQNSSSGLLPFVPADNASVDNLEALMTIMAASKSTTGVESGVTLSVNGQSYTDYDYIIKDSPGTISSFTSTDYFTDTANPNEKIAFVVIKGNVTMDGINFEPSTPKIFTAIYIDGNLTLTNSSISMKGRGGEHADYSAAANFKVTSSVFFNNSVGNGGNGGLNAYNVGSASQTSYYGKNGGRFSGGGGGAGGLYTGSNGITFNGGNSAQTDAEPRGGRGGTAPRTFNQWNTGGGAGNTPGSGIKENPTGFANDGEQGCGGSLFVIVNGQLSGSGTSTGNHFDARGMAGGNSRQDSAGQNSAGGGSGGGRIYVLYKTLSGSTPSLSAAGGSGGTSNSGGSRNGNSGTAGGTTIQTY